jgi:hypothetical protein
MATYISLVQFTDKGIMAAKETTHRGGKRIALSGHPRQHPHPDAARFHQRRDGEDPRQHSLI